MLCIAANTGYVHACTLLLANNLHMNQQENNEVMPLWRAAQNSHAYKCSMLLEDNVHVNQQVNKLMMVHLCCA